MRIWIKDPLAILAPDAERGVVVDGAEIVECVAARTLARDALRRRRSTPRAMSCCRASSTRTIISIRR